MVYLMFHQGEDLNVTYERPSDGKTYQTVITPKYSEEDETYLMGDLGLLGELPESNQLSLFDL